MCLLAVHVNDAKIPFTGPNASYLRFLNGTEIMQQNLTRKRVFVHYVFVYLARKYLGKKRTPGLCRGLTRFWFGYRCELLRLPTRLSLFQTAGDIFRFAST